MRVLLRRRFALCALSLSVAATALAGCSAEADLDDEETESDEAAVTAARPVEAVRGVRILQGKTWTSRPTKKRTDVTVFAPSDVPSDFENVPREIRRATSSVYTWAGEKRVILSGNATGSAAIDTSGFLLVEILDAGTSEVLAASTVRARYQTHFGGKRMSNDYYQRSRLPGTAPDRLGIDITDSLPKNRKFRIRISGLTHTSTASIGDVFLTVEEPLREDSTWCSVPLTSEQASQLRVRLRAGRAANDIPSELGIPIIGAKSEAFVITSAGWTKGSDQDGIAGEVLIHRQLEPGFVSIQRQTVSVPAAALVPRLALGNSTTIFDWSAAAALAAHSNVTGRWLFDSTVNLRVHSTFDTGAVGVIGLQSSTREHKPLRGDSSFRVGNGCYQLRNIWDGAHNGKVVTVSSGTFAPLP